MWNKLLTIGLGIAVLTSCSARKKVVKVTPDVNNNVVNTSNANADYLINNLDFHTFSGRAKAKIEFGEDKQDVTMHVRIQKNKAIWISVTGLLNIEGARLLITPDSVRILNKLQGEYLAKPFKYIHKYTGEGVNFGVLQDLLTANVSSDLLRTDKMTVAKATEDVQLVGVKDELSFQYSLNNKFRPKVFRLSTVGSGSSLEAFYSAFNDVTGYNFPQNQNIKLRASAMQVDAIVNYNKIDFNQELEMPFTVPAKYKVLD